LNAVNETREGRILFVRFSSLGDVILTEPAVRAVRAAFPGFDIHYLTKTHYAEIVEWFPSRPRVLPYDSSTGLRGLLELLLEMRKTGYDCLIDLHDSTRSLIARAVLRAREKRIVRKESLRRFLLARFGIGEKRSWKSVLERYFECLPPRATVPVPSRPVVEPGESASMEADSLLSAIYGREKGPGTKGTAGFVALAPGARWATKMWPGGRFAELGRRLTEETGARIVVLGGSEDRTLCSAVAGEIGEPAIDLSGRTSLPVAAAVLSRASLLVSNDTALMHLAVAVSTPVVAIFGPTSRELGFYPDPELSTVIEVDLPCRPCTTKGAETCPLGTHDCMMRITVKQVFEGSLELLQSHRAVKA